MSGSDYSEFPQLKTIIDENNEKKMLNNYNNYTSGSNSGVLSMGSSFGLVNKRSNSQQANSLLSLLGPNHGKYGALKPLSPHNRNM